MTREAPVPGHTSIQRPTLAPVASPNDPPSPPSGDKDARTKFLAAFAFGLSLVAIVLQLRGAGERDIRTDSSSPPGSIEAFEEKLTELENRIEKQELNELIRTGMRGHVDLASESIQDLDQNGMHVVGLAAKEELAGIRVSGRLLNTQSVAHTKIEMKVRIGGEEVSFDVKRVSPGSSTAFSVYVPNIKPEDARYATFTYQNSYMHYRK